MRRAAGDVPQDRAVDQEGVPVAAMAGAAERLTVKCAVCCDAAWTDQLRRALFLS